MPEPPLRDPADPRPVRRDPPPREPPREDPPDVPDDPDTPSEPIGDPQPYESVAAISSNAGAGFGEFAIGGANPGC